MAGRSDYEHMRCEQAREMLSALLDGEDDPTEREAVDAHLDGCVGCRRWLDQAAEVTRLARTSVVKPVRDLSGAVLDALPATRFARLAWTLRLLLGLVGAAQLVLGLAQIGQGGPAGHVHVGGDPAVTPAHLWHESAAWNVAVGAGFLFIAVRRTRPKALLPTLTVFVAVLLLLSVGDLAAERVSLTRLVTHGLILAGYLIIVVLSRPSLDPGEPPAERSTSGPRWRVRFEERQPEVETRALRLVRPPAGQAYHHDQRRAA